MSQNELEPAKLVGFVFMSNLLFNGKYGIIYIV